MTSACAIAVGYFLQAANDMLTQGDEFMFFGLGEPSPLVRLTFSRLIAKFSPGTSQSLVSRRG